MPDRDLGLPHQVVLGYSQDGKQDITVSCNCRARRNSNGTITYEPMATISNHREAVVTYNDPINHKTNQGVSFDYTMFIRLPQP